MSANPHDAPSTLADMPPDIGYAYVNLLYEAGALCCMEYEAQGIHSECVWHHPDKADALLHPAILVCTKHDLWGDPRNSCFRCDSDFCKANPFA